MKRIAFLIIALFSLNLTAQDCDCQADLEFVAKQLKSTPSYKSQMSNPLIFNGAKAAIAQSIATDDNIALNCLGHLQKFLKVLKDEHIYITARQKIYFARYVTVFPGTVDELIALAKQEDERSIAGIYDLLSLYRVAVVKDPKAEGGYLGYILESKNDSWQPGQLKFKLDLKDNHFDGLFYAGNHMPVYKKIAFKDGRLYPERWVKEEFAAQHAANNYLLKDPVFQYSLLGKGLHYVRLGDFDGDNETYAKAMDLLETLEKEVQNGKVIIDLRNNGGGGQRTSNPFLKLFKKRKSNLEFHLVQNNLVGSNSEHFLLKLKKQLQATTYGEPTRGALAYGFGNYSSPSLITPCNNYSLGLTKSRYEKYLEYEVVGIPPDFELDHKTDWINQILAKIE